MDFLAGDVTAKILSTVLPLVLIVSIGYFYARRTPTDLAVANRVNIDVFIPALVFSVMASKSLNVTQYQGLALAAAVVVLGPGLLLWPACRWLKTSPRTFLPPMMFNNCGNLGLPLAVLAFGESGLAAAVVMFMVANLLHFTVGITMVGRWHQANPLKLIKMPVIWASVLGIVWNLKQWPLPDSVALALEMLGQISIPLMLFALGARMTDVDLSHARLGVIGALLCPLSGVVMALLAQLFLQLPEQQFSYLLLFAALPPAVLNYMIAERFHQQPHVVASVVLIGNMASLLIIPAVLFWVL